MPKIKIAGRELVVAPATLGFVKRKLLPWKAKISASMDEIAAIDSSVEGILLYLGDQVDAAWVEANIVDPGKTLTMLREAAGQVGASGEAAGP